MVISKVIDESADELPTDRVINCLVPAVEFRATEVSLDWKVGAGVFAVDKVANPPREPSLVQFVPEIFDAEAVNETAGVGTAATAGWRKKIPRSVKRTPVTKTEVLFNMREFR